MGAPLAAAGITALGGLTEGILAGIGQGQQRKWMEKMLGEERKWKEKWRLGEWEHRAGLRGELEKRLAPTTGYIGMSPALQGDVTRAIMGQAQRYLGEDVMQKYGIDVGGYFSGEKLAKPELPYMYRDQGGVEPTGGTTLGRGTSPIRGGGEMLGGTRPGREDEMDFMKRTRRPKMI